LLMESVSHTKLVKLWPLKVLKQMLVKLFMVISRPLTMNSKQRPMPITRN
jgi:hypothetical protein